MAYRYNLSGIGVTYFWMVLSHTQMLLVAVWIQSQTQSEIIRKNIYLSSIVSEQENTLSKYISA